MSTLVNKISMYRNSDSWGVYVGACIGIILLGTIIGLYHVNPGLTLHISLLLVNEIGGIACGTLIAAALLVAYSIEETDRAGKVLCCKLLGGGAIALIASLSAGISMLHV